MKSNSRTRLADPKPGESNQADYQMAIYDRYGNMVFRTSDPGRGWDGTYGGAKVPSGNFVWMVRYFNTETKQPVFRKGQVLVIR